MSDYLNFEGDLCERILSLLQYQPEAPMTLTSGLFIFAFLVFGVGYISVRKWRYLRTLYVVLFSLYFYYKLSGIYILLLLLIAISDFTIGHGVARRKAKQRSTRGLVALSLIINLSILIYFKATNFFVESLNSIFGEGTIVWGNVIVPAGVSFFIFQSIAYVVDIARGTIVPLKRLSDYIFLLAFFPKMFLGPIVKARDFIPQIEARNIEVSREEFGRAVKLIAQGLIKYAIIAKCLGTLLVTPAFSGELGANGMVALMAIYGFTLQIYCDFSGYSDIAIGVALLMGFRLPDNFDAPYKSATITEFWRRWHISLSTWLKEYLYISLGGNRKGMLRTYLNLIITMLLGGLWHGVGITFILWGLLHGVALALHKIWLKINPWAKATGEQMHPIQRVVATILTFHVVALGWLLFTASDISVVDSMLYSIAHDLHWKDIYPLLENSALPLGMMCLGYILHLLPKHMDSSVQKAITRRGLLTQAVVIIIAIWLVLQCNAMLLAEGGGTGLPIYAAF